MLPPDTKEKKHLDKPGVELVSSCKKASIYPLCQYISGRAHTKMLFANSVLVVESCTSLTNPWCTTYFLEDKKSST